MRRGFTLVELTVVLILLVIVVSALSMVLYRVWDFSMEAEVELARQDVLAVALEAFERDARDAAEAVEEAGGVRLGAVRYEWVDAALLRDGERFALPGIEVRLSADGASATLEAVVAGRAPLRRRVFCGAP